MTRAEDENAFAARADALDEQLDRLKKWHGGSHVCVTTPGIYWHHPDLMGVCAQGAVIDCHIQLLRAHVLYYGRLPDAELPVPVITILRKLYSI